MDDGGGQFAQGHLEAAVAADGDHDLFGATKLSTDGRGKTKAHGASAAGGKPLAVVRCLVKLSRPHLVLADVGSHHGATSGQLVQAVDDSLHLEAAALAVFERVFCLPLVDLGQPSGRV